MANDVAVERPCARCGAALHRAEHGDLALEGCGACGGAWLAPATATIALTVRGGAVHHLARKLTENTKPNPVLLARPARCPDCGGALARVTIQGEELDACADHGVWFDHGELLRISAPPALTPQQSSQNVPPGTYSFLELYVRVALVLAIVSAVLGLIAVVAAVGQDEIDLATLAGALFWMVASPFLWLVSRDVGNLLLGLSRRR